MKSIRTIVRNPQSLIRRIWMARFLETTLLFCLLSYAVSGHAIDKVYVREDSSNLVALDGQSNHGLLLEEGIPVDYLGQIHNILSKENLDEAPAQSFALSWLDQEAHQVAENPRELNKITTLIYRIQQAGRIVAQFDGKNLIDLPFGIEGKFGDLPFLIGFDNIRLHADYASVDVFASLYIPFLGDTLFFVAADLKYNNRAGFIGDARLMLVQDFTVEVNPEKSAVIFRGFRRKSSTGSYIDIDCDGIQGVHLGMEFTFNPGFIKPVNSTQRFVRAFTEIDYDRDEGFMADQLSIAPFYFKDFDEVAFALDDLSVDFDETKTTVPEIQDYLNQVELSGHSPGISVDQWTGFYCKNFQVIVGSTYITNGTGKPVIIRGQGVVIDDLGFTAQLDVDKEIISLDRGSLYGWAFSIDRVHLGILANQLKDFGFSGLVHVPILDEKKAGPKEIGDFENEIGVASVKEETCLRYGAHYLLDSSHLSLRVEKLDDHIFSIPMLFAEVNILPGSYLQLVTGRAPKIEAYLNAGLTFDGKLDDYSSLKISQILFEGLYVANRAPYLAVKQIHPIKEDSSRLGKYPFTFESISLVDHEPALYAGQLKKLSVENLSMDLGEIVSGDAIRISSSLDIFLGLESEDSKQKWKGKGIRINKFGFEGTLPGIDYLQGELAFYRRDPIYGTGFYGGGIVRFGFMNGDVNMMCQFGTTGDSGYKYSFVDAALNLEEPSTGDKAFNVEMLLAGYHKNMIRDDITEFKVGPILKGNEDYQTLELGGQFPKNRFMPSKDSWGIRGGLIAKVGEGAIMGVRIIYERQQSQQQGMSSRFFFEGLVEILPKDDIQESSAKERIVNAGEVQQPFDRSVPGEFGGKGAFGGYIRLDISKNSEGNTLNAALGMHGQLGPIGVAFYGEYYKSPDQWHLFIGTPENRAGLSYGEELSDVVSASIGMFGYFMIGNSAFMPKDLPVPYAQSPANQSNLRIAFDSLRQNSSSNIFANNAVDLGEGNAIALGVSLGLRAAINIPDAQRRWLFIDAGADIGFDLLLHRSKPECTRMNTSQVGLNNWYWHGQMYAGIAASVGFVIKQRMLKIFDGAACLVLTGGGFGPTWAVGTWRLQYQFLWKKGEAQGIFKFGQPCNNINASFDPARILEKIYPSHLVPLKDSLSSEKVVGINSDFRMDFMMPADRRIQQSLVDFESGETENFYTHLVSEVSIEQANGEVMTGNILYDHNGRTMIFRPSHMLTPGDRISLHVKSTVYDDRGIFHLDGQTFSVDTTIYYQVDPEGIFGLTTQDVAVSYPMVNQQYFHKDEFDQVMISFGKELPLAEDIELSSHLFEATDEGFKPIEGSKFKSRNIGFVHPTFKSLQNLKQYRWVVTVESSSGKRADVAAIDFSTSEFARFSEKAETLSIEPVYLSNHMDDTILPLKLLTNEPLESLPGNVNTIFIANQIKKDNPSINVNNKIVKGTSENITEGAAYLTRILSTFIKNKSYNYFQEIYNHHIPYGSAVEINCVVDDQTSDDKEKAKPSEAVQFHRMYPWTDKNLAFERDIVQYNILRDLKYDHLAFLAAKPPIPTYYADCENYSQGPIPFYKPSLYSIKLRYFLPGFEQYSSTSVNVDFRIEE